MSDYSTDPFFQVPTSSVSTSEGSVDVPALYYEASNLRRCFGWTLVRRRPNWLGPV